VTEGPQPDPLPSPRHSLMRRFWRIFRLLALLSIVIAAIAVVLVVSGEEDVRVHMLIATALGAGLTVLLGSALMTLAFLSSSSGHDQQATPRIRDEDKDSE
jgi:gamma-glutamylcysteine synthetase